MLLTVSESSVPGKFVDGRPGRSGPAGKERVSTCNHSREWILSPECNRGAFRCPVQCRNGQDRKRRSSRRPGFLAWARFAKASGHCDQPASVRDRGTRAQIGQRSRTGGLPVPGSLPKLPCRDAQLPKVTSRKVATPHVVRSASRASEYPGFVKSAGQFIVSAVTDSKKRVLSVRLSLRFGTI